VGSGKLNNYHKTQNQRPTVLPLVYFFEMSRKKAFESFSRPGIIFFNLRGWEGPYRNCPIRLITITSKDIMAKGLTCGLQDKELISVILILD